MQSTNTLVQAFAYGQKPVRTIIVDDEPWFALTDVCSVLDIKQPKHFLNSRRCDQEGVRQAYPLQSPGGVQETTLINEPNLYALVLRSDKEESLAFQRWITHEVLPQIRKTGSYRTPLGIDSDPILAALGAIRETRLRQIEMETQVQNHELRLSTIEQERADAKEAMSALPAPTVEVPALSMRKQCIEAVDTLVSVSGHSHQEAWRMAYRHFDLTYSKCLTKRAQNTGMTKLDWIEQNGMIDDLYGIICAMVDRAKKAA